MHTLWKNRVDNFVMQQGWAFAYFSPFLIPSFSKKCLFFPLKIQGADFAAFQDFPLKLLLLHH
jgi:hypothetical protein